ncbi:MAG: TGS domain-containing protein, partial [Clostridiales bacterium]|nr:TGS domain-containing protein [Clostridiales bacterium]
MKKMTLTVNGQQLEFDAGASALDVADKISKDIKKDALVARLNGKPLSLMEPIREDGALEFLTFDDADGKWALRHTASHVMAQAVKALKPEAKLAIGPAIDNGFYYDFDVDEPFTPEFLAAVEREMGKIVKRNSKLERFELPRAEALKFVEGEPYKVELINDLPEDSVISFYKQDGFTDLCAGPHLPSTGKVKAFKLMSIAGAYWRGSEKNKMLQRIYGTAFYTKEELDAYVTRLEEAKKRDHRKLGR